MTIHKKSHVINYCPCCDGEDIVSSPAILMPFLSHRIYNWSPVKIDENWGLNTINCGFGYSICNSLQCVNCNFLFLDIRFTDDELDLLYCDYRGKEYNSLREMYEPGYTLRNNALNMGINYIQHIENFLMPYVNFPLAILDWGGDTGINTPFKEHSSALDIYDISNKDVIDGANKISRAEVSSRNYDLIVCSNVLEHVPYPFDLLVEMRSAMGIDTKLYIEVPYEELMALSQKNAYLSKRHWHEHINFYSPKSLDALLSRAGFKVINSSILNAEAGGKKSRFLQFVCSL